MFKSDAPLCEAGRCCGPTRFVSECEVMRRQTGSGSELLVYQTNNHCREPRTILAKSSSSEMVTNSEGAAAACVPLSFTPNEAYQSTGATNALLSGVTVMAYRLRRQRVTAPAVTV